MCVEREREGEGEILTATPSAKSLFCRILSQLGRWAADAVQQSAVGFLVISLGREQPTSLKDLRYQYGIYMGLKESSSCVFTTVV